MDDVCFYEAFHEEEEALKRCLPSGSRARFTPDTVQEAEDAAPPAPLISIRTQSVVPASWAGSLRGILSRSTGYDHLQAYRRDTGGAVACGYLPLYCARSVAEQAMLLWMALLRRLPRQEKQFRAFHRDGLTGRECEGRYLLVAGVGNIGYEVVRIARGLGMDVHGVDIVRRHEDVDYVSPEVALPRAEIVVCAMNLTTANEGYFRYDVLNGCRNGLLFINIARGELSPSQDLLRLLEEGRLGGVGLDVYNNESDLAVALRTGRDPDDPESRAVLRMMRRDDVVLTPHNAFNTEEAVRRKAEQSAEQVRVFLDTGAFRWPVP